MPMAEPSTIGTSADLIAARPFHRPQVGHPIRELWLDPAGYLACRVGSEAPSHSEDRVRQCEGDKQRQPMQHAVRAAWLDSSAPSLEWGKIRSQQASRPKKSGAPLVATRNLAAFVRTKFRRGGEIRSQQVGERLRAPRECRLAFAPLVATRNLATALFAQAA